MSTRRQFLAASAAVAWTAPAVLSVSRASASQLHSAPPRHDPVKTEPMMGAPLATDLPGQLAYTGPNVERDAEIGIAAVAAGAALYALNRRNPREVL